MGGGQGRVGLFDGRALSGVELKQASLMPQFKQKDEHIYIETMGLPYTEDGRGTRGEVGRAI